MRIKRIVGCLLIVYAAICGIAEAADMGILIKDGNFESRINGFGITYSGRNDTTLPYIFASSEMASSGNGSLRFVASDAVQEQKSTSPQSLGFAYQGIYNTAYLSVEKGRSYTVSADFYTESGNVKMRFIEMDGNKAVAASPEIALTPGVWQTAVYKWDADISTDKNRVRAVFYNIEKNDSIYIDNFVYRADYISDSVWEPDEAGRLTKEEEGFSYTAAAGEFKNYCGIYADVNQDTLDSGKEYVLSGYVTTDMQEAALYVSADNIENCFSEYAVRRGERAYVNLCFSPSMCADDKIRLSLTAVGTSEGAEGKITFSGLQINEADAFASVEQKNGRLCISGKLRNDNENQQLQVSVTGMRDFTKSADGNGEYSFDCALPDVQTSKGVLVSISNLNGYEDCGGVINGYTVIYNDAYRNGIAKSAGEKTSPDAVKAVLTKETLIDTGLSRIKNFRIADQDLVMNYLADADFSSYEELERAVNTGSVLSGLSDKKLNITDAIAKYEVELLLDSVAAYQNEYPKADPAKLEALFKQCTTEIGSMEDLHYVLTEILVKERAEQAVNYSEIMSCITKYADDLSLDFSAYNDLDEQGKYNVANRFTSYLKNADSFKTLQKKLDELVRSEERSEEQGGSRPRPGGSGGAGGSGGSKGTSYDNVVMPPVQKDPAAEKWEFRDLDHAAWAKESIYALLENGIISRSEDGLFRPENRITRAEFAKMVSIKLGLKVTASDAVFGDVNQSDWYFDYVMAISKASQLAPEAPAAVNETIKAKADGKITGVTSDMEYKLEGASEYIAISETEIANLAAGTYLVRYKENTNFLAGADKQLIIADGAMITVSFNSNEGTAVDSITCEYNQAITAPTEPTKENFVFAGWYKDAECLDLWNFGNALTEDITLYAKWNDKPVYSVNGKVTDGESGLGGITITLKQGNTIIATTTTAADGSYSFITEDGLYNIVAEKEENDNSTIKTVKIEVIESANVNDVVFVATDINSELEIKPDTPQIIVGGLDEEAQTVSSSNGNVDVTVKMTVESKEDITGNDNVEGQEQRQTEQKEIKKVSGNRYIQFIEINLTQSISGAESTKLEETSGLIEIIIPFEKGNKRNITVYRYHGSVAEKLGAGIGNANADGEYFEVKENHIVVYAKKFSTYAIGYDLPSSGGGGSSVTRYTVKFDTNGGSSVSSATVTKNAKVAEPKTPEKDGYTFGGWYTDEALTEKYDFDSKVTKNLTLYAKWDKHDDEQPGTDTHNCPSLAFDDLDITKWYHFDTDYVIENGIFKGTTETTFEPDSAQTRAMMVTVLYRAEGEPAVNRSIPFADVDMGAYYANAVIWGQQNGIIKGYSETEFGPDDKITREQIAAIMHRYAQYKGIDVSIGENTNILFYDDFDSISEYAIPSIQWAVGSGMIKGKSESTLNPLDNATRAEIAAILHRFIEAN